MALRPETLAIRGGFDRTGYEETSEPIFLTSGYVYESAEAADAAFNGDVERFVYTRYASPTVEMFQDRMRLMEGAEACFATATGMAAVFNALIAAAHAGDRVVAPRQLFSSSFNILKDILPRYGIETEFVNGTDLADWERALARPAAAVLLETPTNPMMELVDVAAVAELGHRAGATVVVDNVFATSLLQKPLDLGADVVVYSATKHIDGQGRVHGGAILGTEEFVTGPVQELMRNTGPSLSPFNAWVLAKGLETLSVRVNAAQAAAEKIARWLEQQPGVGRVYYPFLESSPQYELAQRQMSGGGTMLSFDVLDASGSASQAAAWKLMNGLNIIDISNNLGDSKSLITHPATSTHRSVGPQARAEAGITDGALRLSVGLEHVDDLIEDLDAALTGLR